MGARGVVRRKYQKSPGNEVKAGVNVKAALTSLNISSDAKSLLISLTTVWRFCVNFWVIFGHFGKEIFFLKG